MAGTSLSPQKVESSLPNFAVWYRYFTNRQNYGMASLDLVQ